MAQEAVNAVVSALQKGFDQVQRIHESQQQKEEFERQQNLAEKREAAEEAQRKVQNEAAEKMYNLQKAQIDAQLALSRYGTLKDFQQTGIAPPESFGAAALPQTPQSGLNIPLQGGLQQPATPSQNQLIFSATSELPGQTFNVPPIEQSPLARLQRQVAEETEARQEERESKKQEAETERQLKVGAQTAAENIARDQIREAAQTERDRIRETAEIRRTQITAGVSRANALLPYQFFLGSGGGLGMTADDKNKMLKPYTDAIINGDMGIEQVKKEFNEKGMSGVIPAIQGNLLAHGMIIPTDKQVQAKQALAQLPDVMNNIDELIKMLPAGEYSGFGSNIVAGTKGLSTLGNTAIAAKEKELEFNIGTIAKQVGGDQGQRLQKALLDAAHGGFMPSRNMPRSQNVNVRNNFLQEINNIIDSTFKAASPEQRQIIKNSIGINNIPLMKSDGSYATGKQAVPIVAPPQPKLSPQSLKYLKDHNLPIPTGAQ